MPFDATDSFKTSSIGKLKQYKNESIAKWIERRLIGFGSFGKSFGLFLRRWAVLQIWLRSCQTKL
jgi:hypothetical protein